MPGGGKRVPRRRSTWTNEDSKKEIHKWAKIREADPAVKVVHKTLEENLTFFMGEVGNLVSKYEALRDKAKKDKLEHEPKIASVEAAKSSAEGTDDDLVVVRVLRPAEVKAPKKDEGEANTTEGDEVPKKEDNAEKEKNKEDGDDEDSVDDNTSATSEYEGSPDGKVPEFPPNQALLDTFKILKKEAYELNVTFTGIHDWIALSLPDLKMDEEDTMEILDQMMTQVSGLDDTLQQVYGLEGKYIETRTDVECEMLKYPDVVSLPELLALSDIVAWEDVIHGFTSMIRVVVILHTYLTRNMKVLRNPKNQRVNLAM